MNYKLQIARGLSGTAPRLDKGRGPQMRRSALRLALLLATCHLSLVTAFATTVTGTVKDSQGNPVAGAVVRLQLENCGAGGVCTLAGGGGIVSTLPVSTTTASDGTFSIVVNGNDTITPAGTFYEVRYIASSGTIYSANYNVTGTSFNLNNATPLGAMPPAPIAAAYTTVAQGGTNLQQRQVVNFTGSGVSCADNSGLSRTDCTVTAGSGSGITSLNSLTASTQTFATATSGSDFNIASSVSTHTFNFPNASATARGLLASADWSTFNGKQNALSFPLTVTQGGTGNSSAGTSGQVLISNGTSFAAGDPIVSGPDATGVAPTKNPVQTGALDNSTGCSLGPCVRSFALANATPAGTEYGLITRNIPSGTQAVSGTFWQATQPVSGTVTANAGTGTFTVSGTVTANAGTGTFNISAIPAGTNTIGSVDIASGQSVAVTQSSGANLHTDVDSLPALPAGTNTIGNVGLNSGTNTIGSVKVTDGTNTVVVDPCEANAGSQAVINLTASGQLITGAASKQTYICSINIITATAQNIALVEGTGTTCGTGTAGMAGGASAATGWNFAANGGLAYGNGRGWIFKTATAGDNVCLLLSSTGQTSGTVRYVQQ
jgi:hypothetical protein